MINLNKKDSVADAVKSILQHEETDVKSRTKDDIGGKKKTTQVDDVGPGADGKSTKVKLAAEETKKLSLNATEVTEKPEPQELKDANKTEKNKKQLRMKESTTLKGFKARYEEHTIFDQMIAEVLSKDASAGEWIHDFVHSDNPKFAGKSKAERKKQALAAYYAKQRNEETEQVEESMGEKAAGDLDFISKVKGVAKKVGRVLGGPDDEGHKKDLQRKMGIPQTGKPSMAKQNEEVEVLDEGKMDKMSLSQLWHKHAQHTYGADQGWGGGQGGHHSHHAATAIENHVRKHHGNKVADDMLDHSDLHVAHAEYVGGSDAKKTEKEAEALRKKHGIKGDLYGMHNESVEQIDELSKKTIKSYILKKHDKMYSNPAQDPKKARKDLDNLTGAMHRSTGVKPTSEETVEEGWDDMLADVKKRNAPQPNGGSGKKQGSRYGGSKQQDKPEHDEDKKKVNEGKRPEDDSVPFAPPYSKTPAETTDKSGAHHTPMSRAHHLARLAMKKVKADLGNKGK